VNPEQVTRININNDSLRHPYLSYKMVKIIRSYRKAHGNFRAPEDIRNITLFNDEIYRKIAPYLTAE
jgi:DNA uptake protein ComE-like DNA-binding protein